MAAERRRPTPALTPEDRDIWRDGGRIGWRDGGGREGWREGRESGVVQSYSFDSYQLEEEEISKDAPERGVLALSEPGERLFTTVLFPHYSVLFLEGRKQWDTTVSKLNTRGNCGKRKLVCCQVTPVAQRPS